MGGLGALRRWLQTTARRRNPGVAAIGALLVAVAVSPANGFIGGVVAYQRDTAVFYYPLFTWAAQQLHAGRFPLWLPEILGGYPLFADGEIGLASPQVLLALLALPVDIAFVGLRLLHVGIGAVGAYALARAWRMPRAASVLAGLTFSLGSFLQAHVHHENIVRTAVWLPLILACVEHALRSRPSLRLRWIVAGAAALGLAGVGLHPQILAADLLAIGVYGLARGLIGPGIESRATRTARALIAVAGSCVLGLGLAAVQLVPLAELASLSARAGSFPYTEVAGQSLTPYGLVQLVLPYVFRDQQLRQWGLWTHWESYLYVGLVPLLLVLVALSRVRRRAIALWVVLGSVGLVLALGQYAPVDVFAWLRGVPGLGWLRAPGRFALIVDLALAMLAAQGLVLLQARARHARLSRPSIRLVAAALALPVVVATATVSVAMAVSAAPDATKQLIETHYLSLPRDSRWMNAADVYGGLQWSFSLLNPRTAGALLGLIALAIAIIAWQAGPWLRARRWSGWPAVLVVATAADLLVFSWSIHPREALSALAAPHPTVGAVRDLVQRLDPDDGPVRVLAAPVLNQVASDRLAPFGLHEAGGYSSLEPSRHRAYLRRMRQVDDDLLDLWNVRYILDPAQYGALNSYAGVSYLPGNVVLRAPGHTEVGEETLRLPPDFPISEVRVISALAGGGDVAQSQPVAALVLRSQTGAIVAQTTLRAGREVMDWGWDDLAPWGGAQHARVEVAGEVPERIAEGVSIRRQLSFGRITFEPAVSASTLEIDSLTPRGELIVQAIALANRDGQTYQLFGRSHKQKYREVYRADGIVVLENMDAFPRAYVVDGYRSVSPEASLDYMERRAFAPRREVVLAAETPPIEPRRAVAAAAGGRASPLGPGTASIERYAPHAIEVEVTAPQDSFLVLSDAFYPGWRAFVDGTERPILRGNQMFRVVQVPEGRHRVIFRFEPDSVRLGLAISLVAVAAALVALMATRVHARPAR